VNGPLILGRDTATGQPVGVNLAAALAAGRAPGVLLTGAIATGKTVALARLGHEALRHGSRVVNIAPRDLTIDADEDVIIDLSDPDRLPGVLDPLRLGTGAICGQVATHALLTLLHPSSGWEREREITTAVRDATQRHGDRADLSDVLDLLRGGTPLTPSGLSAGEALAVAADFGLGRLVFPARAQRTHTLGRLWRRTGAGRAPDPEAVRQVRDHQLAFGATTIRLPLDACRIDYSSPAADHSLAERATAAVMILAVAYALALASRTRRHTLLLLDSPASGIIGSTRGRAALAQLAQLAPTCNTSIAIATDNPVAPAGGLGPLFATRLAFWQPEEGRARALDLLDLADSGWGDRLAHYPPGIGLLRDYTGRLSEIQVQMVDNPRRHAEVAV